MRDMLQLAMLEEVRAPEPPIRLSAIFFEPGSAAQVAAELRSLGELVVAVGAPLHEPLEGRPGRDCDALLLRLGIAPQKPSRVTRALAELLHGMAIFRPDGGDGHDGPVGEGAYHDAPVFETNADGVFCALQGRRLPARRHPLGMQMRIEELRGDHVLDEGGELGAHRYAVGHACWLGEPSEAVVVLPGSAVPEDLPTQGVLPPVERLQLPPVTE